VSAHHYDLVIVGGGMVGAALACALADSDLRLAIIDARAPDTAFTPDTFDLRVSAITRASQHLFENLDAWPGMQARRVTPYQEMRVWDATGRGSIHFSAADIGEPDLGHIIENRVILGALTERLQAAANIDLLAPARPLRLQPAHQQPASLTLADGRQLHARLIVGADGARSWVRRQLGIDCLGWSYGQKGLVATVRPQHGHHDTAWQRFLPSGPLALLPLGREHCSIVWSCAEEEAEQLLQLPPDAFLQRLNQALGDTPLGRIEHSGPRAAFPLRLQHARSYIGPRVALVGDAAHTIHPLAGQGVNLGLLDAATLAGRVLELQQQGRDFGHSLRLRQYQRARKADNLLMMASMDAFKRLFSNDNPLLSRIRNTGLALADAASPLKHQLMRQAMGLDARLPQLSQARWHVD